MQGKKTCRAKRRCAQRAKKSLRNGGFGGKIYNRKMWGPPAPGGAEKHYAEGIMPTKKSSEPVFLNPGDLADKTPRVDVNAEADKVVKKLNADKGLLDSFKTNGLATLQNLLPAIKDSGVLNSILEAVLSKLNLGSLLGGLGSLLTGQDNASASTSEKPKTSSKKKKKTGSTSGKTGSSSGKTGSTSGKKKTSSTSSGKKKTSSSSGKKKTSSKKEEKKDDGGLLSGLMGLISGK